MKRSNEIHSIFTSYDEGKICGTTAIARGCFGNLETNQDLKNEPGSEAYHDMIDGVGFSAGYKWPHDTDILSDEIQDKHVTYATALVQRVAQMRGWLDGHSSRRGVIDHLITSSISSTPDLQERIVDRLKKRHEIIVEQSHVVFGVCASLGIDLLSLIKHLKPGERGAFDVGNSLSGSWVDPSQYAIRATFHNAWFAGAVEAEDAEVLDFRGRVKHDDYGVIRLPRMLHPIPAEIGTPWENFKVEADPGQVAFKGPYSMIKSLPTLKGTQEEKVGDDDKEHAFMDGKMTGVLFKNEGAEEEYEGLEFYEKELEPHFGPLSPDGLAHPPSKSVLTGINKGLDRLIRRAITEGRQHIPKPYEFEWIMQDRGVRNSSDATMADYILEQIRRKKLKPDVAIPVLVCGVGLTVAWGVVKWNRK